MDIVSADVNNNSRIFTFTFSQHFQVCLDVGCSGPRNTIDYGHWSRYFHASQNRVANYQGSFNRFLSRCVTEGGESVGNVNEGLMLHRRLTFTTIFPNCNPLALLRRLCQGLSRGKAS